MTVFDADRPADVDPVVVDDNLLDDVDLIDLREADDREVLGSDEDYEWATP